MPVNSEDRLVQETFADHLERVLGWASTYAWKRETFGRDSTLGRTDRKEAVLTRDLRAALERLNPELPAAAIIDAMRDLTVYDVSRSTLQHNREFYRLLRAGVPVKYRDEHGVTKSARARVIDFDNAPGSNRFLAVRELELTGRRTPNYNRRADLVCFVNGLPLVVNRTEGRLQEHPRGLRQQPVRLHGRRASSPMPSITTRSWWSRMGTRHVTARSRAAGTTSPSGRGWTRWTPAGWKPRRC